MSTLLSSRREPGSPRRAKVRKPSLPADPRASALEAGLRYSSDRSPGIERVQAGKTVRYRDRAGRTIRDAATLARIKALAIPPAWTSVWISPWENGHVQATGRDAKGRKQYRYHARWRVERNSTKYEKMAAFGHSLVKIRRTTIRDLKRPGLPERKVFAAVVRLLETSLIRVGNDEYAEKNKSFGLTTMRDRHASVRGQTLRFEFRGKSGINHAVAIEDARLARVVKQCQDLPGQELFQYVDDSGQARDVTSDGVNNYLREIAGDDYSAKDFRTWAGTVLALVALREFAEFDSKVQAKKNIVRAIESVAKRLGNTPAVCRQCYIHPAVIDSYLDGTLLETLRQRAESEMKHVRGLSPEEAAVLVLLQRRLALEQANDRARRSGRSAGRAASTTPR
jgi:DNA topoisomerase-1